MYKPQSSRRHECSVNYTTKLCFCSFAGMLRGCFHAGSCIAFCRLGASEIFENRMEFDAQICKTKGRERGCISDNSWIDILLILVPFAHLNCDQVGSKNNFWEVGKLTVKHGKKKPGPPMRRSGFLKAPDFKTLLIYRYMCT